MRALVCVYRRRLLVGLTGSTWFDTQPPGHKKQDAEGNLILATATHTHLISSDMSCGEQSNNQKQEQLRSETREFQWFRAREELHAKNKV